MTCVIIDRSIFIKIILKNIIMLKLFSSLTVYLNNKIVNNSDYLNPFSISTFQFVSIYFFPL